MTFDDEQSSSDREIIILYQEAIEQIKKVDADLSQQEKEIKTIADEKKKDIITRLAKALEGKILTNTICMEVVIQLRGYASESFIRKCLDLKYKDIRRSKNASSQNKPHSNKMEENTEKSTKDFRKASVQDPEAVSEDIEDKVDDNLALIGVLDQEEEEEEEEEEKEKEIEEITEQEIHTTTADGQILLQRGKGKGNDSGDDGNHNKDSSLSDASTEEKTLDEQPVTQPREDEEGQQPISRLNNNYLEECPSCKELYYENCELKEIIQKSGQLITPADKFYVKGYDGSSTAKVEKASGNDLLSFEFSKTLKEIRNYMTPLFEKIGDDVLVWFNGKVDKKSGKTVYSGFGRLDAQSEKSIE